MTHAKMAHPSAVARATATDIVFMYSLLVFAATMTRSENAKSQQCCRYPRIVRDILERAGAAKFFTLTHFLPRS
jgi:hypothetical protein